MPGLPGSTIDQNDTLYRSLFCAPCGPPDANGVSTDDFSSAQFDQPNNDIITLRHRYFVGDSGNGIGCLLQTYSPVTYTTHGMVGNGF